MKENATHMTHPILLPAAWTHEGLVLPRKHDGGNSDVVGDPCIVWDEAIPGWRMFLFYDPPGCGQAICRDRASVGAGHWTFLGPLAFTNPDAMIHGGLHKPWIVTLADQPHQAARVDGRYWLLAVSHAPKRIQRAWSNHLAGPWTIEGGALIPNGSDQDFDAKHTDAVTGTFFPDRDLFLYFYMGYPLAAQPRRSLSPYGSAQGAAIQGRGELTVNKLGEILPPSLQPGHWASGWVGGLQLLPGADHRWLGLVNASPTAVDPRKDAVWTEEPPPSLGGFAWCDEEFPVTNWNWYASPVERIEDIPTEAQSNGEQVNLWRHFLLRLDAARLALFYNSGSYGKEQLYWKLGRV